MWILFVLTIFCADNLLSRNFSQKFVRFARIICLVIEENAQMDTKFSKFSGGGPQTQNHPEAPTRENHLDTICSRLTLFTRRLWVLSKWATQRLLGSWTMGPRVRRTHLCTGRSTPGQNYQLYFGLLHRLNTCVWQALFKIFTVFTNDITAGADPGLDYRRHSDLAAYLRHYGRPTRGHCMGPNMPREELFSGTRSM